MGERVARRKRGERTGKTVQLRPSNPFDLIRVIANSQNDPRKAVAEDPKRRFRYIVHLFAKEIVLVNFGKPEDERLLERMVEVLTHIQARA